MQSFPCLIKTLPRLDGGKGVFGTERGLAKWLARHPLERF